MIVSASYRTDIPAFYGAWFMARLAAGHCLVSNPYGGRPYRVDLRPEAVDGFVFWSKNLRPFLPHLEAVGARTPFVVQLTINGYPRALETSVTEPDRAVADARGVARRWGPRAVVWRYDPILLSDLTPWAWHLATFARLAAALEGVTDEVVTSFAHFYAKTRRNLLAAGRRHGFTCEDPADKPARLQELAAVAARHGMRLTLCAQPDFLSDGVEPARCVDAARLADVAGHPIAARVKGNRPGCFCAESRDIGAYDSCPHGCVYCYAVRDRAAARRGYARHDPDGDYLLPPAAAAPQPALADR